MPRQYVHKQALAEVLLTGWHQVTEDVFLVGAQWSRSHGFYTPGEGTYDPVLFVETVRQTIPLLSHLAYDVPFGYHLIWDHFSFELAPGTMAVGPTPAGLELRIECSDVRRRRDRLTALTMNVTATRDGRHLGIARARFTSQPPAVYQRLRGAYGDLAAAVARTLPLAPPVPPQRVGRDRFHDVVLSPTDSGQVWQLRVDTGHPVLFDHPVDHVPGILLIEAAHQATRAALGPHRCVSVLGMESVFTQYVELDSPCLIEATVLPGEAGGRVRTRVVARQAGREMFSAVVTSEAPTAADLVEQAAEGQLLPA
ncbi:ScbA/BarX family gamma-butyrolactone biosynthesis protein [Streptomyces sp. Edi4]|uniref:ScbA/BarX family gamma-butyrolactone biosynthesis protein n=1 Tax=Streptomyces sp. Edi4 TaxID=3162527 RepID=UPI0033065C3D